MKKYDISIWIEEIIYKAEITERYGLADNEIFYSGMSSKSFIL